MPGNFLSITFSQIGSKGGPNLPRSDPDSGWAGLNLFRQFGRDGTICIARWDLRHYPDAKYRSIVHLRRSEKT